MSLMPAWVESANTAQTDFPLNNLPYGVFSRAGSEPRCCVAIGDMLLDLHALEARGFLEFGGSLRAGAWNDFMARGRADWTRLRNVLTGLLGAGAAAQAELEPHLHAQSQVRMHLPFRVTEYTDFYSSRHHATNVGTMFRGADAALPPNWEHMPIGYNGRASSVVVSGSPVRRPMGQVKAAGDASPRFAASARFDFELEIGAVVGRSSDGPLSVAEADAAIFGYVILNDWSARDIQAWEYQPLGPFQGKATATTLSPWIVTADALRAHRVPTPARDAPLLPYLQEPGPMLYDISLEVAMAPHGSSEQVITRTNYAEMSYSSAQQLAHHASSGCPMRVGDLLGSGTISGPDRGTRGSMLELSWGGKEPLSLADGVTRSFLEDGDRVVMRGAARAADHRIGFGDCAGTLLPARG